MIKLVSAAIDKIYLGSTSIKGVFLGSDLIFGNIIPYDPYDMTDFVSGYRVHTNGALRAGANYIVSKFYELTAGHTYKVYVPGGSKTYTYGYTYNSSKTGLTQTSINNTSKIGTFTAAQADIYYRITFMIANLADSYIQDTTTGKYLFKGSNL